MRLQLLKLSILSVLIFGIVSCNLIPKSFDLSVSASDGKDFSVVLAGCGQGIHSGYLFCRKNQGSLPTEMVDVYVPKVTCDRESCTEIQFLNKDGSFGFNSSVKKGENKLQVQISTIIGHPDPIGLESDGEYSVISKIFFTGPDKLDHITFSKGVIRVLVLDEKYQTLACNDPQLGWTDEISKDCHIDHSTAYRSAVCGACEPKVSIQ